MQRLLGKKTMEAEILKEALDHATGSKKTDVALALAADVQSSGRYPMMAICETLGVARSNVVARMAGRPLKCMGRPPLPEANLLKEIEAVIDGQSSWAISASGRIFAGKPVPRVVLRLTAGGFTAS